MSRGIYSITAIALMIFANLTSHSSAAERKDCSAMLDRCFQGCMSRGKTDAQIVTCGNHCQQVDYNNCIDSGGIPVLQRCQTIAHCRQDGRTAQFASVKRDPISRNCASRSRTAHEMPRLRRLRLSL